MALPSARRCAIIICLGIWLGLQAFFFMPESYSSTVLSLASKEGVFQIFQIEREAIMIGAFSDRYGSFPRMELVPFLKKRGIRVIQNLILTGHEKFQTGALSDLQKNFKVNQISYPLGSAAQMRRTFNLIQPQVRLKRIEPESPQDDKENHPETEKEVPD